MTHYVYVASSSFTWFLEYVFVNEVSAPMLMQRCSFLGFKKMLSLYIYGTLKKKAYGWVPRNETWCSVKKKSGVAEKHVRVVKDISNLW